MGFNLGDKVIVSKKVVKGNQGGSKSVPIIVDVEPFEAVVTGVNVACEGGNGHAPKPVMPVYEVKTTLKNGFRVPVDGLTAVSAKITQPVVSQVAQVLVSAIQPPFVPVMVNTPAQQVPAIALPATNGQQPTAQELDQFVAEGIQEKINTRTNFTAWDITQWIRANKSTGVYHSQLRDLVHQQVGPLVGIVLAVGRHPAGAILYQIL